MNTGDWIQIGFLLLSLALVVLLVYSWLSWPLWVSALLTLMILLGVRWVKRRIEL